MASAQILTNGKALYAYNGTEWIPLNTSGNLINATRWTKVITTNTTSLSGNDDSNESLIYTPGFEQVFLNGVLLVRDVDYTATTGTTITGLATISAGNIIEVIAYNNINLGNTYTQSQIDNKIANTFTRWVETLSASATVLSGLDDNSNTLSYTPGLEQVYVNGILLLPSEYTATSGSTVVLSEAAVSGDVIQIYTLKNFRVPNTYTITQTDDQFLTKTSASSTYLSQSSASGSYLTTASAASLYTPITSNGLVKISSTTYSGVSSQAFDSVFSSTYRAYIVEIRETSSTNNQFTVRYRASGSTDSTLNYSYQKAEFNSTTVSAQRSLSNDAYSVFSFTSQNHCVDLLFVDPYGTDAHKALHARCFTGAEMTYMSGKFNTTTSFDGFIIIANTGTITGTATIWGLRA